jgi:hypothetical protein
MTNMGNVAKKAARSPLFRDLGNVPLEVRRIVTRLVKSGHVGRRLEPREGGGTEYYLWNERIAKAREMAKRQVHLENASRQTPIFIGSNRGADLCVSVPGDQIDDAVDQLSLDEIDTLFDFILEK